MLGANIPENFTLHQRILPLGAALVIALVTIELIRRRRLREEYAMLWMLASGVLLVFAIFPTILWHISSSLGIYYLTTMGILSFSFLALVLLHLSIVISRNADDKRRMAQRIALLQREVELLKQSRAEPAEPPADEAQESSPPGE